MGRDVARFGLRAEPALQTPDGVIDLTTPPHLTIDLRDLEPHRRDSQDGHHVVSVGGRPAHAPQLEGLVTASWAQRAVKRTIDVVIGLLALVLLSPFVLIAALAVKLTSPGPMFYPQVRVGRNGRLFRIYKVRSMYVDAHAQRDEIEELNEATGPVFKMRRDPRVTPVGRIVRKLSIDEIPQLVNVLKGEMSLVGPRPPLPEEVESYSPAERCRLLVPPGLTCIWQVSGRSDIGFAEWVEMDIRYIHEWSVWLDLSLLLRTIPAIVSGRGAY